MAMISNQHLPSGTELHSSAYTYTIKKVLGQGSFGITYLATTRVRIKAAIEGALGKLQQDRWEEVQVAIKEFFMRETNSRHGESSRVDGSDSQLSQNYRKKFRKEAENLSHLNHPNIVKVLEVFDANNTSYYVMEYIEGRTLDECIPQGGLGEEEAIPVIRTVADGLKYMHKHRMLHLDIKPKNIMMTKEGGIKLIDFGLSKQYNENDEPETSTSIGLGTPGYAPLEQSNYKQDGSFPATLDIYALGATYYKMLTGQTPPPAADVLDEGLPPLPGKLSLLSVKAIDAAMQPRKKNRPQNVEDFISILNKRDEETEFEAESIPIIPQPKVIAEQNIKSEWLAEKAQSSFKLPLSYTDKIPLPPNTSVKISKSNLWGRFLIGMAVTLIIISGIAFSYNAITSMDEHNYQTEPLMGRPTDTITRKTEATRATGTAKVQTNISKPEPSQTTAIASSDQSSEVMTEIIYTEEKQSEKKSEEADKQVETKIETNNPTKHQYSTIPQQLQQPIKTDAQKAILDNMIKNMKEVEAGTFKMGSRTKIYNGDEKPRHNVTLTRNFYINRYEVTQEEWEALMGNNPSIYKGKKLPVHNVSWAQCQEFIKKLNQYYNTDIYRLPTEAEWEFAAKGGNYSKNYHFAGSNDYKIVAWVYHNSNGEPHPIGQKQCNELGIYDMTGNVQEWCNDKFGAYSSSDQTDPKGAAVGNLRVVRGEGFLSGAINDYGSYIPRRYKKNEDYQHHTLGFRLAATKK